MKIKMPAQAAKVIQTLEQHGFEAYIVGGCVRDQFDGFDMEHICHFPSCFCCVSFDGMC